MISHGLGSLIILISLFIALPTRGAELLVIDPEASCAFIGNSVDREIYSFESTTAARKVVRRITEAIGIPSNFTIKAASVENAVATSKNNKRYVLYSTQFMKRITDRANTDWAALSIMAHEIGHHLANHTLLGGGSRPTMELEADRFSGQAVGLLGGNLEDAQSAITQLSSNKGSNTHPPKFARLEAISVGWHKAQEIRSTSPLEKPEVRRVTKQQAAGRSNKNQYKINGLGTFYFGMPKSKLVEAFGGGGSSVDESDSRISLGKRNIWGTVFTTEVEFDENGKLTEVTLIYIEKPHEDISLGKKKLKNRIVPKIKDTFGLHQVTVGEFKSSSDKNEYHGNVISSPVAGGALLLGHWSINNNPWVFSCIKVKDWNECDFRTGIVMQITISHKQNDPHNYGVKRMGLVTTLEGQQWDVYDKKNYW